MAATPLRPTPSRPPGRGTSPARRPRTAALSALWAAGVLALAGQLLTPAASAGPDDAIAPRPGPYGYFVDAYSGNVEENTTVETNPAIGVLAGMLEVWQPGAAWDDGTVLDARVHEANLDRNAAIAAARTPAEEDYAYVIDRRHQSYSALDGLGPYAPAFRVAMNAGTTIPDEVPADAATVVHNDTGNENGVWADTGPDTELGSVTELVNTVRGWYTTSNNAKNFYQYPRPFRWAGTEDVVIWSLEPRRSPNPATDGGFPSGHTNAAYLASLALAHAVPQQYDDLVENAAGMGHSRIVAGFHSSLDVVGGRVLGTATAAAVLANPAYEGIRATALADAQQLLAASPAVESIDLSPAAQAEYRDRAQAYRASMVEGFEQLGDPTLPAVVPKGAEALLETRFPYLDADQLRWLLRSTAIESGYPLLDDPEGWGRLDLFAAANGYGAFDSDVAVTLDGEEDVWRNDVSGPGSLTLGGTGSLALTGANDYRGGTVLDGGRLLAASPAALGTGTVEVSAGELVDATDGTVLVGGDYRQAADGALTLTVEDATALAVTGAADLGGALRVELPEGTTLEEPITLVEYGSLAAGTAFASFEVTGLAGEDAELVYGEHALVLRAAQDAGTPSPTPTSPSPTAPGSPEPSSPSTPTSSATPGTTAAASTPAGASGRLSDTGAPVGGVVVLTLVLLTLGSGALAHVRRRNAGA
ncbi:MAG: phosphatase PAP2 family protein [Salana multivorans]|uniref:phosphatase PAP2 family protein n=1 Tax=Salana multivorans TaxID=120377 RepID=UPI00095F6264|nr:phosphatase PAP2 family protein [Salana multivorans]MBN8880982.1 phosphatase PAP2 family protein [Salana multivorans]OJX96054.1 MAG: hypothetical protein BGO96_07135 [Micrococcales bacterium 73-15]